MARYKTRFLNNSISLAQIEEESPEGYDVVFCWLMTATNGSGQQMYKNTLLTEYLQRRAGLAAKEKSCVLFPDSAGFIKQT